MTFIDRPQKDTSVIVQTFLTKEQVDLMRQKLNEYVEQGGRGARELRAYALLSISTMARINAIANVRWDQIDFDERIIDDVLEKEGKVVTLYFSDEVKDVLLDLKEHREKENIEDGGFVFYTKYLNEFRAIRTSSLNDWCKKIGNMIDVPTLHPHDFRHSGSQLLKLAGCPIEEISTLLHHESIDTTKKFYLRQDKKKLREVKDRYSF